MKIVITIVILIGLSIGGYTLWLLNDAGKKLAFFTEDTPIWFKDIEWSPTRNLLESLNYGNLDRYGEYQEGYDSKGRLVIRHVLMNEDIPVVAYYFSGGDTLNVQSTLWIIDCEPNLKLEEDLICWKNGKFVHNMREWSYMRAIQTGQLNLSGFTYWSHTFEVDSEKLERNKKLNGSFTEGGYFN